ncbi:UNVERIFIED_CONTAM: hypothetical protein FKN15_032558 [Acipenser sinensis]
MFRKKVDNRIRVQIENGVAEQHRTLFVVVGNHGRDQVVILHHMLSKATVKARPSVLWCYKKELGFSSHRKKRMRQLQKKIKSGTLNINEDDPFELFVAATNIRYCYYNETHKILGNTFGMCVLQDFEALTPNLLARTIETVEGGGIVVILLRTMNSLKKLYTMTMDVHSRYRTEAHQDVVGRFNERKKVDNRIRVQIENGVAEQHRTLFVVVGNHGRDQDFEALTPNLLARTVETVEGGGIVVILLRTMNSLKKLYTMTMDVHSRYRTEAHQDVVGRFNESHRKKRMRQLQKKIKSGTLNINEDDPFELFVAATNIRYCYYNETHKILGNTFGMCVLQDFEALTPNLLARTIETVEGGGIVVILLRTMNSLKKLYTMTMVCLRLTMQPPRATASEDNAALGSLQASPQAPGQTTGVAGARFILSLASCKNCVAIDDQLNILPISSHIANIKPVPPKSQEDSLTPREVELKELKESLQDTQPVGVLVDSCKTLDQAKAVLKFIEAISEKTLRSTVALTAARGRGKSAALGLAVAGAVAFGYSNIFVTSPSPDNLHTLFEFIFKGFDALEYQEHLDYEIIQSLNPEFNKAVVRVNIFKEHRQTIQYIHPGDAVKLGQAELLVIDEAAAIPLPLYIHPGDAVKLGQAELLVIDEAAAIPLPLVRKLLGPYLVFMASTINGYEGTGRSLSLKLIQQLRQQSAESQLSLTAENKTTSTARLTSARSLHEVTLHESIRYAPGDAVEKWLNNLLCLDCLNIPRIISGCPLPQSCELYPSLLLSAILLHYIAGLALLCRYYVNRDTLFCYHRASEAFLQKLMALYVASHYKNSPNDLQMLSDAPAHHLFCLLPPVPTTQNSLPEVLAVIQVCLEGEISRQSILNSLSRGKKASGDLIPWTVSEQVCLEGEISRQSILNSLSRGKKASGDLIPWTVSEQFQDPEFGSLSGGRVIRIAVHPDYQGMGYGSRALQLVQMYFEGQFPCLEENALKTVSEFTRVNSEAVSLLEEVVSPRKDLPPLLLKLSERPAERLDYLGVSYGLTPTLLKFWKRAGFVPVYLRQTQNDLTGENTCIMLKELNSEEASQQSNWLPAFWKVLSRAQLDADFTAYDLKRLDMYSRNMVDYHLIMDMIPNIAKMFFLKQLGDISLSAAQSALLLGIGLQHKTVDQLEREIELPSSQLMGLFNRLIRKVVQVFTSIQEKAVEEQMVASKEIVMEPTIKTLTEDLDEAAQEFQEKHKKEMEKIKEMDLTQYMIRGDDEEWNAVLNKAGQNAALVTLKSNKKRKLLDAPEKEEPRQNKKLKNKNKEKNKTKRGKFNNQRLPALVAAFHGDSTLNKGSVSLSPPWVPPVTLVAVLGFPSSPLAPLLGWGAARHNARILSVEYHRFYRNNGICSSVQNPDSCLTIKDQSERDDSTEREMGANDQDESPTAGQQPQQAELFPGHKALKIAPERDVKHLCCLLNLCVQQLEHQVIDFGSSQQEQECEEKRERAVSLASEHNLLDRGKDLHYSKMIMVQLDDNMGTLKLITEMALNDQKDAEKGIERMQKMVCKLREKEQRETQRKGNTEQSVGNESHP